MEPTQPHIPIYVGGLSDAMKRFRKDLTLDQGARG